LEVLAALRTLGEGHRLGPLESYLADLRRLEDYERLVFTPWLPIYIQSGQLVRLDRLRLQQLNLLLNGLPFRGIGGRLGQGGFQGGDRLPVRLPSLCVLLDALIEGPLLQGQLASGVAQRGQAVAQRMLCAAQPDLAAGNAGQAFDVPQEVFDGGDCGFRGHRTGEPRQAQGQYPEDDRAARSIPAAVLDESGLPILRSGTSLAAGRRRPRHMQLEGGIVDGIPKQ
jgi:hypothetical protein